MKKVLNYALILVLFVGVLFVTGCNNDDPTKDFKNPKVLTIKGDKGSVEVTYDDDKKYEEQESSDEMILKSSDYNMRISFAFSSDTIKDLKTRRDNFSKDSKYEVIKEVEFRGNKGYVIIDKTYATAQVYLFLDETKDVAFVAKVSDMSPSTTEKLIESKGAKDALYNTEKVQEVLSTIKYIKK